MTGLKRNLRYWGVTFQKSALLLILYTTFLGFLLSASLGEDFTSLLSAIILMMAIMTIYINVINTVNTYLPYTVSLGSKRMDSYIVMQIMNHVMIAEFLLVFYLTCLLWKNQILLDLLRSTPLSFVGMVILMMGIGNLIGFVLVHFGQGIGMIAYIVGLILTVLMCIGFIMGFVYDVTAIEKFLTAFFAQPWLLPVGILLDIIGVYLFGKALRKCDLTFGA